MTDAVKVNNLKRKLSAAILVEVDAAAEYRANTDNQQLFIRAINATHNRLKLEMRLEKLSKPVANRCDACGGSGAFCC
jgi:hypothetical protein